MGHDDDPEYKDELDDNKYNNAVMFVAKINRLEEKLPYKLILNSGWRPKDYNLKIGGSEHSNHIICRAGDFKDVDNSLGYYFKLNVQLLADIGLCMENPEFTKGWVHLQDVMPRSGRRIFNP